MDDAKRRALIKSQASRQKETGEIVVPKGTVSAAKRKQPSKSDRPHKQQKVPLEPVVGLMAEGTKTVTPIKHGSSKGLMKAPSTSQRSLLLSFVTQIRLGEAFFYNLVRGLRGFG